MRFSVTCNRASFMVVLTVVGKHGSSGLCGEAEVLPSGAGTVPRVLLRHCLSDTQGPTLTAPW